MVVYPLLLFSSVVDSLSVSPILGADMRKVVTTIHTIQQSGLAECVQGLYYSPAWGGIATTLMRGGQGPAVVVDRNLGMRPLAAMQVVNYPAGAEWCVGWILLVENLEELEETINLIRFYQTCHCLTICLTLYLDSS